MSNHSSIKYWKIDDQPREKLRDKGKSILSDTELLAILIGSGNKEESAVQLAQRILASANNNLNELSKYTILDLCKFKGIGEAKAITIIAAITLGLRMQSEMILDKPKISSSKDVYTIMQAHLRGLAHEEFWILYLNNSNKIIQKNLLSKGGITGTLVDVRLVLKTALEVGAVALILCHNHPSGTLQPSDADKLITKKLKTAAKSLDIDVLDHIIITEKAYFSFADEHIL